MTSRLPPAALAIQRGRQPRREAFRVPGVKLAAVDGTKGRFRLEPAYSGIPFFHPFWGNTAFDLATFQLMSQREPALRDHNSAKIVGFTESIQVSQDRGVVIDGVFSEYTADGKEVAATAAEGFPWEVSIAGQPASSQDYSWVREGEEVTVNGHILKGPGTIFRNAIFQEVSFTPVGADPMTSASFAAGAAALEHAIIAFSVDGGAQRQKETPMTLPATPSTPASLLADPAFRRSVDAGIAAGLASRDARLALAEGKQPEPIQLEALLAGLVDGPGKIDEEKCRQWYNSGRFPQLRAEFPSAEHLIAFIRMESLSATKEAPKVLSAFSAEDLTPEEAGCIVGINSVDEPRARALFASSRKIQEDFISTGEPGFLAYLRARSNGVVFRAADQPRGSSISIDTSALMEQSRR